MTRRFGGTSDAGEQRSPAEGWSKMSDGDGGASASTIAGPTQGFVYLSTFAIRKAP